MFVVTLTYTAELAEIDAALHDHAEWLDQQFNDGIFLASGRQIPRKGGVILASGTTRSDLEHRIAEDPFSERGLASYEIAEFNATRVVPGLELLQA
ncbi:uncharacterized protein YciI [Friedmanniella endophytica]|uniref:Uncharacterized protein YciI n=1 Tax=Microlunatus kandeliicorticis TaxID=1759536 RepID=A0A7W3IV79_9ACTN|nr:YciI family protein [Microlunatus kandeliicorticis]MBA8795874.1 uncharacterized protein YciI [Microlunatus kandeliicorticis]